jgi:hypothetical protein
MYSSRVVTCAVFAWLTTVSLTAIAQVEKSESSAAQMTAPVVPYQSVFADYKGFQDPDLVSWRQANDLVANTSSPGSHDMSTMSSASEGNDMSSMPGHDMSKMKKEERKATKPSADEANKDSQAKGGMPDMKGMNHADMKSMDKNMPVKKDMR